MDATSSANDSSVLTPQSNVQSAQPVGGAAGTPPEARAYAPQTSGSVTGTALENISNQSSLTVTSISSNKSIPIYKENVVAQTVAAAPVSHPNWPLIGMCVAIVVVSLFVFVKTSKNQYSKELLNVEAKPAKNNSKSKKSKK